MDIMQALEAVEQARDTAHKAMRQFAEDSPSWHYWKGRRDMAQAMIAWLECDDYGD